MRNVGIDLLLASRLTSNSGVPEQVEPPIGSGKQPILLDVRLAWAAGFVDGDGCLCAVVNRHRDRETPSIRIRVVIVQNDHHTLLVLQNILDEKSSLNPLKRQPCHNRQVYQLQYDGIHAIAVIRKILPYLVRKSAEADACLKLQIEGEVGRCPGPRGFTAAVHERRAYWVNRIRRMK